MKRVAVVHYPAVIVGIWRGQWKPLRQVCVDPNGVFCFRNGAGRQRVPMFTTLEPPTSMSDGRQVAKLCHGRP